MINHARTLLINIHPSRSDYIDSGYEGYEYIPKEYIPVRLPAYLQSIRKILFGANSDGLFLGLRAHELLSYIHQTELASFLYAFDSRVTYWPNIKEKLYDLSRRKVLVTQTYGAPRRLLVTGDLQATISSGTAYRSYVVALGKEDIDDASLSVYVRRLESPKTEILVSYNNENPPVVTLPQSRVTVKVAEGVLRNVFDNIATEVSNNVVLEMFDQIGAGKMLLETPINFDVTELQTIVAQWYVILRANPTPAILDIIPALTSLGETTFLDLFGLDNREPYVTFKNLWLDHPLPAYRLAGLVLAVIYRTEELRAKNG